MPFKSKAQQAFLEKNKPDIADKFGKDAGKGKLSSEKEQLQKAAARHVKKGATAPKGKRKKGNLPPGLANYLASKKG